jgi:hypothetical protein
MGMRYLTENAGRIAHPVCQLAQALMHGPPEDKPFVDGKRLQDGTEGSDVLVLDPAIAAAGLHMNPIRRLSESDEHLSGKRLAQNGNASISCHYVSHS